MATLHLMVGLPCSGKTTLAKKLEHELPALRLNLDEWHICLFGQDAEEPEHDACLGSRCLRSCAPIEARPNYQSKFLPLLILSFSDFKIS
jgi:hypothetical protein